MADASKRARLEETFHFQLFDPERDFDEFRRCIAQSRDEFAAGFDSPRTRQRVTDLMNEGMQKDMSSPDAVIKRFGNKELGEGFLCIARHADDMPNGPVAGCVGCVRANPFEIELVRLFVDSRFRRSGLGQVLTRKVIEYASETGYERVFLYCGAKPGQAMYRRVGFNQANQYFFWMPLASSKRKLHKVVIVGGVHGNELVGTHLVQQFYIPKKGGLEEIAADSFEVEAVLANPKATEECVRFVHRDLNRCFALDELQHGIPEEVNKYETMRASELNKRYGPKTDIRGSIEQWKRENPDSFDYMIDLHGTTSNMGICFITLAGDALTLRMALRAKKALESSGQDMPRFNLLVDSSCPRDVYNNIDGITPSGLCIEVGPQAHGTLNNVKLVAGTHLAVKECLEEIREFNQRSKPVLTEETNIEGFELWKTISFPKTSKEASTVAAALHPSLVGADFTKELKKGDPLFVDILTGETCGVYEEDEPAYACFIGEAAYFTSGIAMWLCKKRNFPVYG